MHSAACGRQLGFWPYTEMPMLAPPIDTRLGSPFSTPGQRAQPMFSNTFLVTGLVSAAARAVA